MARRSVWGTVALLLALLFVTTHGLRGSASQVEGQEARTTLRSRGGSRFNAKAIEGLEVTSSPFSPSSPAPPNRSRSNRRGGSRAEDATSPERVATTTPKSRRDRDRDIKLSAAGHARKSSASPAQPASADRRRNGSAFAARKSTTQIPQREAPATPVTEPTRQVKSNEHRAGSTSPKENDEPRRIGLFRTRNGIGRKSPSTTTTTTEEPEIVTTEEFNSNKELDVTGPSVFSGTTEVPRSRTGRKIQTTLSSRDLKRGLPSSGRYSSRKNLERTGGQTAERRSDDSSARRRHDIVPSGSESVSVDVTVPGDLRTRSRIDNSLSTSSSRASDSTTEFSSQRKASTESSDRRGRGRGRFNDDKNPEAPSTSRSASRRGSSRLSDASPVDNSLDRNSRSRNDASSRVRNGESKSRNSDGSEGNPRGRGRSQQTSSNRVSSVSSRTSSAERNSGRNKSVERRGRPAEIKVTTETKISTSEGRGRSRVKSRAIGSNVVPPTTTSAPAETTVSTSTATTASTETPATSTTTTTTTPPPTTTTTTARTPRAQDRADTTTEGRAPGNRGRVTTAASADRRAFKEDFFNHGLGFRGRKIATEGPPASTEAQTVAQRNPNSESPARGNPGWTLKRRPSFHQEQTVTESGAAVISNEIPTNQASQATTPSVAKAGRGNKNFKKTSAQSKVNVDFEESDNYPKEFKAKLALLKSGQESTSRPGLGAISEKNPSRHTRSTSVPSESEAPNEDHVVTASESSVATVVPIIPETATPPSAPSDIDTSNGLSKKRPTTDPQFVARSRQKLESARKLVHRPEASNNVGSEEDKIAATSTKAPTTRKSGEPVAKRPAAAKTEAAPKKPEERKASTFAKRFGTARPENSSRVSVARKAEKNVPRFPKARKNEDTVTTVTLDDLDGNLPTESSTLPYTTEESVATTAQITQPPKTQILSRRAKEIPRQGISTTTRRSRAWITQHEDKNFQEPAAKKSSESSTRRSAGSSTTTRKTRAWNVAYIDKNWQEPSPKYTTESSRSKTTTTKRSRIWSAVHLDKNWQEPTVKTVTHGLPTIEGHSTVSRGRSKPQESTSPATTEKAAADSGEKNSGSRYTRKKTEVFKPFEATPKSSTTEEPAQSARRRTEFRPRTATYRRHSEPPAVMVVNAVPAEKSPSTGNSIAITPKTPVKFHATVRGTDVNSSQRSARQEPTVNVRISDGNGNTTDRASGIVGTSNGASGNADSNIFSPTRSTLLLNSNATLLEQLRSTVAPLLNALGNRTPIFSAAYNDNVADSSSGARVTPSGAPPRFSARYKGAELFVRRPNVLEPAGPFLTSSTTPFTPTEDTGSAPPISVESPGEPKVLTFYQALETASITNELGQTDLQQRQIASSAQVDARNATDSDSNGTTNANNDTNTPTTTTTTAAMPSTPVSINEATVASITMDSSITTIETTPQATDPTTQQETVTPTPSAVTILPETTDTTATVADDSASGAANDTSSIESAATPDEDSGTMTPDGNPTSTQLASTTTMPGSLEAITTVSAATETSTAATVTSTEAATESSTEAATTKEVATTLNDDSPRVTTEASLVGRIVYLETDGNSTSTTAANDVTTSDSTTSSQESSLATDVTDGSSATDVTSEMITTVQSSSEVPMTTTVQPDTTVQAMSVTEATSFDAGTTSSVNSGLEIIFETATTAPETTTAAGTTDLPEATTASGSNGGLEIVVETATSSPETTSVEPQTTSPDASIDNNATLEVVVEPATQVPETTGAAQVTSVPESTSLEATNPGNTTLEMVIELTTSTPETTAQAMSAPETTAAQATSAPETTTAQAMSTPETTAAQVTSAPETTTAQAMSAPETTAAQVTSAPETTTAQAMSAPETTAAQATSAPETTTVQATSAPETTTVQATTAPEATTTQETSAPEMTTVQATSSPETMIPETTTEAGGNSTPDVVDTATSAPDTTTATQTTSPPETTTASVDPTPEMAMETATVAGETTPAAQTTDTSNMADSTTPISSTTANNPTTMSAATTNSETSTGSVEIDARFQDSTMAQVTEENLQMTSTPASITPDSGVTETPALSTTPAESIGSSTQTMLEMIRARLGNDTDMPGLQGDSLMSRMMKRLMMTLFSDSSEEISSENVIETSAQSDDQSNTTVSTTSSSADEVPSLLGGFLDNTDGNLTGNLVSISQNGNFVTESLETTSQSPETTILSQTPQSEVTTPTTTTTTPTANPNPTEATTLIPTTTPQVEDQQRSQTSSSNPLEDVASTLPTDVTNVTTNELSETTTLTATTTTTTATTTIVENSTMDLSQTNQSNGDLAINNVTTTGDDGVTNTNVPETTTATITTTTTTTTATIDTTTVPGPTNDVPNSLAGLQDTTTATAQRTASDDPQATSQPDQTATSGSTTSAPVASSETVVTTTTSAPTTVPIATTTTTDAPTSLPTTSITESSTTVPSTTAQSSASSSTSSEVSSTSAAAASSEMPTTGASASTSSDVPTSAETFASSEMSTSSEMPTTSEISATMESTMAAAQPDNSTSTVAPGIDTTMATSNVTSESIMSTEASTMTANDTNAEMSSTTLAPIMTTASTTTPSPTTTQYLGRFGGSRITPAPRFSVSSSTKTPLRDYLVYGIFPNKTIVRKRPEDNLIDARNVDSPYVIFGIFPDGKLVRKFPNGTVIPDPPTNPVEVVFSLSTTTSTTNRPRPVFIDNQPANRGYYYNQNAALYNNRPGDAGSTPGGLPGQVNLGLSGNAIGPNGEAPASQPVATKMSDYVLNTRTGTGGNSATTSSPTIVTPSNVNTQGGRFIQDRERDEASRSREAGGQRSTVYIGQEKFINYWSNGNPADTNNSRLVSVKINSVASSVNEGPASSSGSQQASFDILPNSQTGGGGQVTAPPGFPWKDPLDQIFGITTQSAIITASVASNTLDDTSPSRSPIMSPPINPLAEVFSPSVATLGPTTSATTTTLAPTTSTTTTTTTAAPTTTTTAAPTTTTTTTPAPTTTTTTTPAPTTTTTTTPAPTTTTTTTTPAPTTTTTTTTTPAPTTTTTTAATSTTAATTPIVTTVAPTTLDGPRQTAFGTTFDDLAFLNSLLQKPSTGGSGGATPKTLTEVEQLLANKILSLALADPGPTRSPKAIQSSNVSPNSVFSDLSPGPSSRPIIIDLLQTTSTAKPIPTQAPTVSVVTPTVTTKKPSQPAPTTSAPVRTTVPPKTTRKPQSQVVITARPVAPRRPTTTQAPQGFGAGLLQALFGGNFFGTPSTTQRPVQATWRPVQASKPIQTTAKPVQTTASPVQTTLAPIRTTSIQSPVIQEVHVTPRSVETSKVQSNTPNSLSSGAKPLATTTTVRTSTYSNEDDAKFLAALLKATGQGGAKLGGGLNTQDDAKFLADLLKATEQGGGAKRGGFTTTTVPSTQGLSIDDEAFLRTILNGQASVQPAAANSQAISDAALLAALLKAQGIEPSTPANRLREQLQSANGNGLQAARPATTTRPRPIPVTTKKLVTPPPRAPQPIWSPSSTYPPPLFSNFANFGSAPERPRGESGAEAPVGDGSVRSQVFNAAIGATRAFSQFLGAAITGAAQQLQSFVRNGTRYVTEVVG